MKRVYYSELLDKNFNTKDECVEAETKYQEKKEKEEAERLIKQQREKELKDLIEETSKELAETIEYRDANLDDEVEELIEEYSKKITDLAEEGQIKIDSLEKGYEDDINVLKSRKSELVAQYVKEFGPLKISKTYEGKDAIKAFNRAKAMHNSNFADVFKEVEKFKRIFNI